VLLVILLAAEEPNSGVVGGWQRGRHRLQTDAAAGQIVRAGNCRVYVEFEIELGNYPRCRSGKPIVQAVFADNTDRCDEDDDDTEAGTGKTKSADGKDTDDISRTGCSSRSKTGDNAEDDSTFFSRRVTADNWSMHQTVSVAAKLDFKYDGTQVRQLGVWLRKVDQDGETIERRSLSKFSVSFPTFSV